MRLHDLTLPTPELNLALDEAILLHADRSDCLRFWESPAYAVVLGRSSRYSEEADVVACDNQGVPILRRVSGGATIVSGPGCLMYALVLDARDRPELLDVGKAHELVLGRMVEALKPIAPAVVHAGTSDLAIQQAGSLRKFSGNSLRRVRDRVLYHGTLLYNFDLPLVAKLLEVAPRQPEYRAARDHNEFITNLTASREAIRRAVTKAWQAAPAELDPSIRHLADQLVEDKYALSTWNRSR